MSSKTEKKNTTDNNEWDVKLATILSMFLLLMVGLFLVGWGFDKPHELPYYLAVEIGKALVIAIGVSSFINILLKRQSDKLGKSRKEAERQRDENFRNTVNEQLDLVRSEVFRRAQGIVLENADVVRFYATRDAASKDIKDTLLKSGVTNIKLMGISLNDFVRDEHSELYRAWVDIRQRLKKDDPPPGSDTLDIEILVIDPLSQGAYLRAEAEGTANVTTRLYKEVEMTIIDLLDLVNLYATNVKVKISARVYRTTPNMFLAWTPTYAFAQSYHFRQCHESDPSPTIQYRANPKEHTIHEELKWHFNWIWEEASISISDYRYGNCIGVDAAVREAEIVNMYYDYGKSKERIVKLIELTKDKLWIKGISLHSFFTYDPPTLFSALGDACKRGVDVRVLLIDPFSEQAKLRSFREYLIAHPDSKSESFSDEDKRKQRLFSDTKSSIEFIKTILNGKYTNLGVKLYSSAPDCFTLLTDTAVLVEQYHYGKIDNEKSMGVILGGDVPVTEYKKIDNPKHDLKKDPYQLFEDSFKYVYRHCAQDLSDFITRHTDL